jgi:hypothetical protein
MLGEVLQATLRYPTAAALMRLVVWLKWGTNDARVILGVEVLFGVLVSFEPADRPMVRLTAVRSLGSRA